LAVKYVEMRRSRARPLLRGRRHVQLDATGPALGIIDRATFHDRVVDRSRRTRSRRAARRYGHIPRRCDDRVHRAIRRMGARRAATHRSVLTESTHGRQEPHRDYASEASDSTAALDACAVRNVNSSRKSEK
jgi:hypothetical protein